MTKSKKVDVPKPKPKKQPPRKAAPPPPPPAKSYAKKIAAADSKRDPKKSAKKAEAAEKNVQRALTSSSNGAPPSRQQYNPMDVDMHSAATPSNDSHAEQNIVRNFMEYLYSNPFALSDDQAGHTVQLAKRECASSGVSFQRFLQLLPPSQASILHNAAAYYGLGRQRGGGPRFDSFKNKVSSVLKRGYSGAKAVAPYVASAAKFAAPFAAMYGLQKHNNRKINGALRERDRTIQNVHDNAHHANERNARTIAKVNRLHTNALGGMDLEWNKTRKSDLGNAETMRLAHDMDLEERLIEERNMTNTMLTRAANRHELMREGLRDFGAITERSLLHHAARTDEVATAHNALSGLHNQLTDAHTQLVGYVQDNMEPMADGLVRLRREVEPLMTDRITQLQAPPAYAPPYSPASPHMQRVVRDPAHTAVRDVVDPPRLQVARPVRLRAPDNDNNSDDDVADALAFRRPPTPGRNRRPNASQLFSETRPGVNRIVPRNEGWFRNPWRQ